MYIPLWLVVLGIAVGAVFLVRRIYSTSNEWDQWKREHAEEHDRLWSSIRALNKWQIETHERDEEEAALRLQRAGLPLAPWHEKALQRRRQKDMEIDARLSKETRDQ